MPYRVKGIAGLLYTPEERSVAGLTSDGQHLQAWVQVPEGQVWRPTDGTLIWHPPNAVKATDTAGIGRVVDVVDFETEAFVTAELAKHERYLELIRNKVRSGALKLTAFLASWLGMPFDQDGVELRPFVSQFGREGVSGATKAASDLEAAIVGTSTASGPHADPELKAIALEAVKRYVAAGGDFEAGRAAAADEVLRAVRARGGQAS